MPSPLPKGVHVVKKRLADGSERAYYYWRATGARLPDIDDPSFSRVLRAAKAAPKPAREAAGTLGAVIVEYKRSPAFRNLRPGSKKIYLRCMNAFTSYLDAQIGEIRKRNILAVRDHFADTPGVANQIITTMGAIMKFAVEREYREDNPTHHIERLPTGAHKPWPDEAIAFALANFPERFRRAVILGLYTGQREGDCIAMRWSQYDGDGFTVVQEKTAEPLWVACDPLLKEELDVWKRDAAASTILVNKRGRPWAKASFSTLIAREIKRHVELTGLVFHGLRKSAAKTLAEAGCSAHEIQAITGHRSLAQLQHYTKGADQKVRSMAAIKKLSDYRKLKVETERKYTKK